MNIFDVNGGIFRSDGGILSALKPIFNSAGGIFDTGSSGNTYNHFSNVAAMWPWYGDSHPPAHYHAGTNKTWFAYECVVRAQRACYVRVYDHTALTWSDIYLAGRKSPQDSDDHGNPSIWVDNDGYWYIAYGCHSSTLFLARTTNPHDPSAWIDLTSIVALITYPTVDVTATNDYLLWLRIGDDATSDAYSLVIAPAVTGGAPVWGSVNTIIQLTDARPYAGNHIYLASGEIVIPFTRADSGNLFRQSVYMFVYNPATGNVRNISGSVTVLSALLPITETVLNTSFRIINQQGFGKYGDVPMICLGDDGAKIHVTYSTSDSIQGQYTYMYTQVTDGSATILTPEVIALGAVNGNGQSGAHQSDRQCPVLKPNGDIDVYYVSQSPFTFDWGGDVSRRTRSAAGTWGTAAVVAAAPSTHALNAITPVRQTGHANARVIWAEIVTSVEWQAGVSENNLKCYAYGDGGYLTDAIPAYARGWTPNDISANLLLWLDASNFNRCFNDPGTQVLWASSLSPQAIVPHNTNPARLPTFSHTAWNGSSLPTFSFNGDNSGTGGQGLTDANNPFGATQTVFIAGKRKTQDSGGTTGARPIYLSAVSDGGKLMEVAVLRASTDPAQTIVRASGVGTGSVVSNAPDAFGVNTKAVIVSQLTDNDVRCAVNSGTNGTAGDIGATTGTDFYLASGVSFTDCCNIDISEVIVYNGIPTSDIRANIIAYMRLKWGI